MYHHRRFCQCKACTSAIDLTLKVITHYGEFTGYNVKNFNKLLGKDIIVAHQLLKNDIEQHEYWLVTESLLHDKLPADLAEWMKWMSSVETDEKKDSSTYYILEKISGNKVRLTLDYYLKKNIAAQFLFKRNRKIKMEEELNRSLINLDDLVKQIKLQ